MATNQVYISKLNPTQFVKKIPPVSAQYDTRDMEDFLFADRLQLWEEKKLYKQKWKQTDTIWYQFESNMSPLQIDIFNVDYQDPVITITMDMVAANPRLPGFYIYQAAVSLAGLEDGCYYPRFSPGANPVDQEYGEPMLIKAIHDEPTVLYTYKNSRFHGDIIFETGIQFSFRVEGVLGRYHPASDDTFYRDQSMNVTQLVSKPYPSIPLSHGGSFGIPDWVLEKLNWIWSCDSVYIDQKSYAKDVGSNNSFQGFQINEEEDYPLMGLNMNVTPGINRASKIIMPTVDTSKKFLVSYNIDGTLYGDLSVNVGDNLIPITAIEQ
jgi:hypothetical protein